jgi:molybdopterin adenylyltransferase
VAARRHARRAAELESLLRQLCDEENFDLILTTGGTGPSPRDITPEATRAVLERELPGFGEIMRVAELRPRCPTSILSRATAGTRGTHAHRQPAGQSQGDR